jgi:tRNA1(Val) A37 N6-methylase TrmN6
VSTLLGGRVIHTQPQAGHRTGIEPVLLAASVPARAGQSVLEGGSGAGAGLLCLAARVCIAGLGVERDPALVALARANAIANGFTALAFEIADIETLTGPALHAHAFANPPWHDAASSASPDPGREAAKRAASGLYARWALRMAGLLVARGTLTFAAPAGRLAESLAALQAAGCGSLAVLPLWPKPGRTPKIVLVQGTKGGRAPDRLLPGLQLHLPEGGYTPEAEAILRDGAGLDWGVTSR